MSNEMKSGAALANQDVPRKRTSKDEKNEVHNTRKRYNKNNNKEDNAKSRRYNPQRSGIGQIKKFRVYRTRVIPIWLRMVIVLVLLLLASICGLVIGFGVIGDGDPTDALKWKTYQHILDLISGKE